MRAITWDGVSVDGTDQMRMGLPTTADRPYRAAVNLQTRMSRTPVLQSFEYEPRTLTFTVVPTPSVLASQPDLFAFEELVYGLFRVGGSLRRLVVRRNYSDDATEMYCDGVITSFESNPETRLDFRGELLVPDGFYYDMDEIVESDPTFTVLGNADARPIVTVTSGVTGDRYRVTVTDRTTHGLGGWMNAITWANPADETFVWINGVPMPFIVTGGRLWFRTDVMAGMPTKVDVYHIAGASNLEYADQMREAGTTLDANLANRTSVTAGMATAGANDVSASLTWHPGISAAHHSGLPYTFGLEGENRIVLIDREASGQRRQFGDDADSFIFTSPVELSAISSFDVTVASGVRLPDPTESSSETEEAQTVQTQNTKNGPAYLRVKVGAHGRTIGEVYGEDGWRGTGHTSSLFVEFRQLGEEEDGIASSGDLPDPESSTVFLFGGSEGECYSGELQVDEEGPTVGETLSGDFEREYYNQLWFMDGSSIRSGIAAAIDGGSVSTVETTDGGWTYLVTFPQGSYQGNDLPFPSFSNSSEISMIVQFAWVDVNGNVITDDETGTPKDGKIRLVLRYRVRDDETWYTQWSQVVNGNLAASAQAITVPAQTFPSGAVQIALGLESVADGKTSIDWGELVPVTMPTMTFMAGKTPLISVSSAIGTQYLDGLVSVDDDGDDVADSWIRMIGVFADTGVEFDCQDIWVDPVDSSSPVYGRFEFSDPNAWISLPPGEITVDDGALTTTFSYRNRWAV